MIQSIGGRLKDWMGLKEGRGREGKRKKVGEMKREERSGVKRIATYEISCTVP